MAGVELDNVGEAVNGETGCGRELLPPICQRIRRRRELVIAVNKPFPLQHVHRAAPHPFRFLVWQIQLKHLAPV